MPQVSGLGTKWTCPLSGVCGHWPDDAERLLLTQADIGAAIWRDAVRYTLVRVRSSTQDEADEATGTYHSASRRRRLAARCARAAADNPSRWLHERSVRHHHGAEPCLLLGVKRTSI
jgi:hypothetical protein